MAAGAAIGAWQRGAATDDTAATVFDTPRPLPEFSLVDETGAALGREDLTGNWSLLFFGFTTCPDVCPNTLHTLARAQEYFAAPAPTVFLVTVDPARDDPGKLAQYLTYFDERFRGVTGPQTAIESFAQTLGVAFGRVDLDDGNYTMDHTAALFFIDPQARLAAVSTPPHSAQQIAADLATLANSSN